VTYAAEVLADTPVGYWRLNDASGTVAVDASGSGHDGTYVGAPALGVTSPITSDAAAKAVTFNGTSQYVSIPDHADFRIVGDVAIECWTKTASAAAGTLMGFMENTGSYHGYASILGFGAAGKVDLYNQGFHNTTPVINDGEWHHLVASLSGTTLTFWLDDVLTDTFTGVTPTVSSSVTRYLAVLDPLIDYLSGSMAECAVYAHSLSGARVAAHYSAAAGGGGPVVAPVVPGLRGALSRHHLR